MSKEMKALTEKRATLAKEMQEILTAAKGETRAFTEKENNRLGEIEQEIGAIDNTIETEKRATALLAKQSPAEGSSDGEQGDNANEAEERALLSHIISKAEGRLPEQRAGEQNITMGNNGAIIPTSIANRIINKVNEICPIHSRATRFAVKGTLKVPVYGDTENGHNITVGYQDEFKKIVADAGRFTSVDLSGYLTGAETLIGKSVLNNSEINVLDFIVNEMAKRISLFLEKEELTGNAGKATGALFTNNVLKAGSKTAINADMLIELQAKVPTAYQANACWTMHPNTLTALRKLKDSTGQYLLQTNTGVANGFPYVILGKPVYISDNMPEIGDGARAVLYGDYSGLGVNMREEIGIEVYRELYSELHAISIQAWFEFDSKIIDHQKLAALEMSEITG